MTPLYRFRALHRLPRLTHLDGEAVTAEEKVAAWNFHHPSTDAVAPGSQTVLAR